MATVSVLLCTYNGGNYIARQLDSILLQGAMVNISDDGSSDDTIEILRKYERDYSNVCFRTGPTQGFVRNFFSLIADEEIMSDYFAFSDQDDIWEPNHLERALDFLSEVDSGTPALYASRTRLIDADGREIGWSPCHPRKPAFQNALIQNIASGNTMVFNRAARDLLAKLGSHAMPAWHDWALYQVVTACGGHVFYSQEPTVRYRQHASNAMGAQSTLRSRGLRLLALLRGHFRSWNTQNIKALAGLGGVMSPESQTVLARFAEVRERSTPWGRVMGIYSLRLYRQTRLGQLGLYVAAFFKLM